MTLTLGSGPFSRTPAAGHFNFDLGVAPQNVIYIEEFPRRIRAVLAGETVLDTTRGKLLHETGHLPVLYAPVEDLRPDVLEATDHTSHCPFKGDASYYSIRVGDRVAENVAWYYPAPHDDAAPIAGHAALYWKKMDAWFEEEEPVFGHLRDPYHRVDVREGSRHVRIEAGGETVAETDRPKLLFETGLPVRFYIPPEDVRSDLLRPTETSSVCPYKGSASWWSVEVGGRRLEDVAFGYPEPLPEAQAVRDHVCFLGEGVETEVSERDGERALTTA
jgi:uncharacterized protein (DUF427 family)